MKYFKKMITYFVMEKYLLTIDSKILFYKSTFTFFSNLSCVYYIYIYICICIIINAKICFFRKKMIKYKYYLNLATH